ncbi:hypothetical protein E9229_003616 [Paeniglutamicibacter cryotolerans]|uniref:Uncharacterized protein n=1 Tax=Paeniglutamicibacter cryotolerans TaxID=670079 RepID=A0A839QMA2_9MICC|nr:hypothetical protein [Paeniglutamicibacter cryotolerans]
MIGTTSAVAEDFASAPAPGTTWLTRLLTAQPLLSAGPEARGVTATACPACC